MLASIKNDRNTIGIEREEKYLKIAKKRIKDLKEGNLKLRPINKPIHKPKLTDKISQIPKEWQNVSLFNNNEKHL